MQVNLHEAKAKLSALVERSRSGEEVRQASRLRDLSNMRSISLPANLDSTRTQVSPWAKTSMTAMPESKST